MKKTSSAHLPNKAKVYFFFLCLILIVVPAIELFIKIPDKEYIVFLTGVLGLSLFFFEQKKSITFNYIDKLVVLFICYQVLHFLIFSQTNTFFEAHWIRVSYACIYFFLRIIYSTYKDLILKGLVYLLLAKVSVEMLIGILQYLGWLKESKTEFFSIVGTHTSPNYFAYSIVVGLLISLWYVFYSYKNLSSSKKLSLLFFITLNIFLLTTTGSRAALVGIIVSSIIFLIKNKILKLSELSLKKKVLTSLVFVICCFILGEKLYDYKKDSADGRLLVAKITSNEIISKPLFGHGIFSFEKGYNTAKASYFKEVKREWNEIKVGDYIHTAMNDYLQITYETGAIGLLLLILIFVIVLFKSSNSNYAILGVLIVFFMATTALFSSVHKNNSLIIYGIIGLILSQHQISFSKKETTIKQYKFIKTFFVFLSIILIVIGCLRIYAEKSIVTNYKNKEKISEIPFENWQKWTHIYSINGLSSFNYGNILYKYYSNKKDGLRLMNKSLLKNIKPKNVRRLAYYYLDLKEFSKAKTLFELNTYTQPFRFEPKMDLIKYYSIIGERKILHEKAQEIIDFPVKIPSKKVTTYKNICKTITEKGG